MSEQLLNTLMDSRVWGEYEPLLARFRGQAQFRLLQDAAGALKREALYHSPIHGPGHIERTMLTAALLAWREAASEEDTALLLLAAGYHDIGRVDDSYDTEHGPRAVSRLAGLTGLGGQPLLLVQCAVAAHSRPDSRMEATLAELAPQDPAHARSLALLLKDADGLDRVRIRDLDPQFLRHESARELAGFAEFLFQLYVERDEAPAAYWCPERRRIILE